VTRNNICNSLIVYGSWSPGGENHHLVKALPGTWKKGKMLVGGKTIGDDLHSGENKQVDAWILKFSDCTAKMFTPEWEEQKRMLFERWTQLDIKMGSKLERNLGDWWPEGKELIRGKNGHLVVNMYVPLQNFPYLKNMNDTPGPEDENDVRKLWQQQLKGEKKYDDSEFIALIKDSTLEECKEAFNELPDIKSFINRLSIFYNDLAYDSGYLLKQTDDGFYLYAIPRPEQEISSLQASMLVKNDLEQKSSLLKNHGFTSGSELLINVDFKISSPPEEDSENDKTTEALEEARELIRESSYDLKDHWKYCLAEACYGISASYAVADYLMSDFYEITYNFDLPYQLWKGGWDYEIHENTCFIFKNRNE